VRVTVEPTIPRTCSGPGTTNVTGAPGAECRPAGVQSTVPLGVMQAAFQSTPAFDGSPVTVAAKFTSDSEGAVAGGSCVIVTPVIVDRIVTLADKALLRSVDERAITVTVLCAGTARGAVKTAVAPLAVCEGENDPQFGALPQLATQSTPAPAVSLLTVAETCALLPTNKEVGGAWVIATEMMGVVAFALVTFPEQPAVPKRAARPTTNKNPRQQRLWRTSSTFLPGRSKSFSTEPTRPNEREFLARNRFFIPSCPFQNSAHLASSNTDSHRPGTHPRSDNG
jgi:hypothetical protein